MTQYKTKLNSSGEYQPYYGYSCISLLGAEAAAYSKKIEDFIKTSELKTCYSALPSESYHMTLFNIFPISKKPIPPVEKWMKDNNESLPGTTWLPQDVLKVQHDLATKSISKLPEKIKIKDVQLFTSEMPSEVLGVLIDLKNEDERKIAVLRQELAQIYEHNDKNLKFHLTLAYKYRSCQKEVIEKDLENLKFLTQSLIGVSLEKHNIYIFITVWRILFQ